MSATIRAADARTIHLWDGLVIFWVVLWGALGVLTGVTVWQAADTGDTITSSGRALHSVGSGLESLADVPVIGDRPAEIGKQVADSADEISARGQVIKGQLRRLGLLLGIAIVGIPAMPVLGFYLPMRVSRKREVLGIRRQLSRQPQDAALDRYLAEHARAALPYDEVVAVTAGRGDDVRRLADAQLSRLGISRPTQG